MTIAAETAQHGNAQACVAQSDERAVLLRAEGLKMAFGGQVILDGIDLELNKGEVVLLRGENGSGKTTLLNILTGNLEPDAGTIHYSADGSPRSYSFPRRWWQELNLFDHFAPEFVAREGIGRTWQDVRLFGAQSLRENIAVAELGHPGENPLRALFMPKQSALREAELDRDAIAMLARFGLAGREDSSADKISLGQSKRVAIARAVAAGAKVLFLDEPLAGLDRQGISEVLSLLELLVRQHCLTLVIVEHIFNHPHLHGLVTTHWLLEKGTIKIASTIEGVQCSDKSALIRPEWFQLLASGDVEIVDEPLPRGAILTRIRRTRLSKRKSVPALEICGLVVNRGPRTVIGLDNHGEITGFNLVINEGEIAILQAPNGWGKSTLFSAISGFAAITQGEIKLQSQSLNKLPTWARIRKGLRVLPSDNHSFPGLRVSEVLSLSGENNSSTDLGYEEQRCSSLSGGELKKVSILATISSTQAAKIILLDEPFSALDGEVSKSIASHLVNNTSGTFLITSPKESEFLSSQHVESKHQSELPPHSQEIIDLLTVRSNAGPYSEKLPPYSSHFNNISLQVQPLVTPLLPSTHSYLNYMAGTTLEGKRILDFGSGSGVLAVVAAILGAEKVDAFDNLPEAVACTMANVQSAGVQSVVRTFEGDGFNSVEERYDLILANLPIVYIEREPVNHHFGLLDPGFSLHRHFIENYRKHLLPGGSAIICHAPLQPEWSFEKFESFLSETGAQFQVVFEFEMNNLPWRLYSLT